MILLLRILKSTYVKITVNNWNTKKKTEQAAQEAMATSSPTSSDQPATLSIHHY